MNWLSTNQKIAAVDHLTKNGWTFQTDQFHPKFDYNNMYGWWIHSTLRPRATGDSRKFYEAAEIAFNLGRYEVTELRSPLEMVYA